MPEALSPDHVPPGVAPADQTPSFADLAALRLRVGTVRRAELNQGARHPAYRLWIDFGEIGEKQSSAKITERYAIEDLVGRQVVAVTGFAPLRVGGFRSDVLVIGALTEDGVVLLRPDSPVPDGSEIA